MPENDTTPPEEARALLEHAIAVSGYANSHRGFAETVMIRDERTLRRWRSGKTRIPEVVVRRLRTIIREAERRAK